MHVRTQVKRLADFDVVAPAQVDCQILFLARFYCYNNMVCACTCIRVCTCILTSASCSSMCNCVCVCVHACVRVSACAFVSSIVFLLFITCTSPSPLLLPVAC